MYTVSKSFTFCYGHRLLGDRHKCRHLHGHTGRATFILAGEELDEKGMLFHFGLLKENVGKWIEENLSHTMLLFRNDPVAPLLEGADEKILIMDSHPTAENIAVLLFDVAKHFELPVIRVEFWESETAMASYGKTMQRSPA